MWLAAVSPCRAPIGWLPPLPCLFTSPRGTHFLYLSNPPSGNLLPIIPWQAGTSRSLLHVYIDVQHWRGLIHSLAGQSDTGAGDTRGIRYNLKLDVKPSRYITARLRMWYVIFLLPCICDTVHHRQLCLNIDCTQGIALRSMWWWWWWCDDTNSASRSVSSWDI